MSEQAENRDDREVESRDDRKPEGQDGRQAVGQDERQSEGKTDHRAERQDGRQADGKADRQSEEQSSEPEHGKRKWEPNRKRKAVKSKKSFDQQKMEHLVDGEKSIYRGELDTRRRDPDWKPRSISRSEAKVRAKAEELAANDPVVSAQRKRVEITDFRDQFEKCKASPGRLGALYATQQVRRRTAFAQEVIESTIDQSRLSKEDRAFATLLTLGVVSTSGSLDEVINRCIDNPRDLQPGVRDALRISTYEIIYLRKAPHAAVDQGVELVRAVAPSASRLGNAVLHRVLKAADVFPFGDPEKSLEALALSYAFPTWLARLLVQDMGVTAACELMRASNDPAPLYIHVNALKASDEEVVALFEETGAALEPASAGGVECKGCFSVSNARVLADGRIRRLFAQGKVLVSDAAAQAVAASVLETFSGENLLEIGAGRGTKTIMLQSNAQRMRGKQIELVSMDSHSFKSDLLRDRAREYGVHIADIVTGNATRLDAVMPDRMFDGIFIDSPCSGLGTLRRHHEIRWRITPERIDELAKTGLDLLKSAAGHVNPGGELTYATCTVTYAENNGVVKSFLESEEGSAFKLAPINGRACFMSQMTKGAPDAHFAAKFIRA